VLGDVYQVPEVPQVHPRVMPAARLGAASFNKPRRTMGPPGIQYRLLLPVIIMPGFAGRVDSPKNRTYSVPTFLGIMGPKWRIETKLVFASMAIRTCTIDTCASALASA
jgi:hypothetical protein